MQGIKIPVRVPVKAGLQEKGNAADKNNIVKNENIKIQQFPEIRLDAAQIDDKAEERKHIIGRPQRLVMKRQIQIKCRLHKL